MITFKSNYFLKFVFLIWTEITLLIKWFLFVDVGTFVNVCDGHHSAQPLQIFPRFLELTRTIRVEKLPPHVNNNYITIFSENPPKGEGVTNVHYFSDESSALVEFSDYRGNQFLFIPWYLQLLLTISYTNEVRLGAT